MSRKSHVKCLFLLVSALVCISSAHAGSPARTMGVKAGPERVFARPVAEIIPELKGATATNKNGRVGAELVFWGYLLDTGKPVQLFTCAPLKNVDCQARIPLICAKGNATVLHTLTEPGDVVIRQCEGVSRAGVGDLHPGCIDTEISNNLLVGLVSCPGS